MTVESDGNMNIAIAEDYICNNNIEQPTYEVLCNREYLERAADLALKSGNGRITTDKRAFIKNRKVYYKSKKKMKKLSDIKNSVHKEFGLSRDSREKVTTLVGLLLEFHDIEMSEFYTNMKSNEADEDGKKREKFVVKFRRVGEEKYKYFITAGVLAERIMEYKSSMPFEATIEERGRGKKRYMVIV